METRYSQVFRLPANLYSPGAPVIIQAGALLKDNKKSAVLAQLKFRSIADKTITAIRIKLIPFGVDGKQNSEEIVYDYLDLRLFRDATFGDKIPVYLTDNSTREFAVMVTLVIFADRTRWETEGEPWESLANADTLKSITNYYDSELLKQYQIQFGKEAKYLPARDKDLWYCACGEINKWAEEKCNSCHCEKSALFSFSIDDLIKDKSIRIEKEKQMQKQLQAQKEEEVKKQKEEDLKRAGKLKIVFYIEVVIGICVLLFLVYQLLKQNGMLP